VRELLEARRSGSELDEHRLREQLGHQGVRADDLDAHLPPGGDGTGAAEFDALVEHGRVRIADRGR
jgi:hypothetical protein